MITYDRVEDESTCENGRNSRAISALDNPIPVSEICSLITHMSEDSTEI
jgi:hypothetical protein